MNHRCPSTVGRSLRRTLDARKGNREEIEVKNKRAVCGALKSKNQRLEDFKPVLVDAQEHAQHPREGQRTKEESISSKRREIQPWMAGPPGAPTPPGRAKRSRRLRQRPVQKTDVT